MYRKIPHVLEITLNSMSFDTWKLANETSVSKEFFNAIFQKNFIYGIS